MKYYSSLIILLILSISSVLFSQVVFIDLEVLDEGSDCAIINVDGSIKIIGSVYSETFTTDKFGKARIIFRDISSVESHIGIDRMSSIHIFGNIMEINLHKRGKVNLDLYDVSGKKIINILNQHVEAGVTQVRIPDKLATQVLLYSFQLNVKSGAKFVSSGKFIYSNSSKHSNYRFNVHKFKTSSGANKTNYSQNASIFSKNLTRTSYPEDITNEEVTIVLNINPTEYTKEYVDTLVVATEYYNDIVVKVNSDLGIYEEYVEDLNNIIHPINGASPELEDDDLLPLSYLGDCLVVGLGEATHGTKEFFQLKHRIFKYLVENHDFKVFGFESDMGESIFIDRYITTGEGNLTDIMINTMQFWTWKTEEVRDLLEWMKTYNETLLESDKIHYIGVDCQTFTYQPELLMEYFNRVKPEYVPEVEPILNMIINMGDSWSVIQQYYEGIDINRKQQIADSLSIMLDIFDIIEDDLLTDSTEFEYKYMKQLVINMQQVNDVYYGNTHNEITNYRDLYMAENVEWLYGDLLGESTKVALWAHNAHVANDMNYGYTGSVGYHIKNKLDSDYKIVGFSFSTGSFTAISGKNRKKTIYAIPLKGSLNYVFVYANHDNFILDIEDISNTSEFGEWVSQSNPFLMIGASFNGNPNDYYRNIVLNEYFDVIINYDITTEAVQLERKDANKKLFSPELLYEY